MVYKLVLNSRRNEHRKYVKDRQKHGTTSRIIHINMYQNIGTFPILHLK